MKAKTDKKELSGELLGAMAETLKILAHPHRLRIVEVLDIHGDAAVNELTERLGLPQATVSRHLGQMRRAGLVKACRNGKSAVYGIADPHSLTILNCIRNRSGK